jgi:hypothetical protein
MSAGDSARAKNAACTLVVAAAIMLGTNTRISDLRRFCARRGMAYEFMFYSTWVVIVTSSTYAIGRWGKTTAWNALRGTRP